MTTARAIRSAMLLGALVTALGVGPAMAVGPGARPAPADAGGGTAVVVTHGPRSAKVVALTFDDGYSPAVCGALVDILVRTRTPATFFVNSVNVVHAPALWRRVAAMGFPIGNHTVDHPFMTRLGYAAQHDEIWRSRQQVEAVLGQATLSVFRPPYGAYNVATLRAARAAGYPILLNWDASFADSSRRRNGRPYPVSAYVEAAAKGRNGSVVLGHCGSPVDVAALPAVIDAYRSRGYRFVTVPELLGLPGSAPMAFPDPVAPTLPVAHRPL